MSSKIQDEALRLLKIKGISGRELQKRSGINRKPFSTTMISNYRNGHKRLTIAMAKRICEAYEVLAKEMTPRVNDIDAD